MNKLKEKDIIKVTITGLQNYGAFVDIDEENKQVKLGTSFS